MKLKTLYFILIAFSTMVNCSKEDDNYTLKNSGFLSINLDVDMTINGVNSGMKSTMAKENFVVKIYNVANQEVMSFDRADAIPAQVELKAGEYYVVAYSNNWQQAAFNNPYYYGRSANFTINISETETVNLVCALANCAVSIVYTDNLKLNFSDYSTEVSTVGGKLTFIKTETRKGYFELAAITIKATLTYSLDDGTIMTKVLNGTIASPEAGSHYEVVLDSKLSNGLSAFNITLNEAEVKQQININDDDSPSGIRPGDLLITEIMYDPDSIADPSGEWFEVYNNSLNIINLKGLIIRRSTNNHEITADILINPGEYYALARTEEAFLGTKYVYNTITLTNSLSTLSIFTFGTNGTDGIEIAGVTYGGSGFPHGSGASINLNPTHFNTVDVQLATSWCLASVPYNTGDMGTPGLPNCNCN